MKSMTKLAILSLALSGAVTLSSAAPANENWSTDRVRHEANW